MGHGSVLSPVSLLTCSSSRPIRVGESPSGASFEGVGRGSVRMTPNEVL
jgi:hypothetical protein